jgi:hypothetical protein
MAVFAVPAESPQPASAIESEVRSVEIEARDAFMVPP